MFIILFSRMNLAKIALRKYNIKEYSNLLLNLFTCRIVLSVKEYVEIYCKIVCIFTGKIIKHMIIYLLLV